MILVPKDIYKLYLSVLQKNNIDSTTINQYIKWFRIYLVFCNKYYFTEQNSDSLPHFIKKLEEKRQSEENRKQNEIFGKTGISAQTYSQITLGIDIRSIQEALGHSNIQTTMIYTHLVKSMPAKKAISPVDLF